MILSLYSRIKEIFALKAFMITTIVYMVVMKKCACPEKRYCKTSIFTAFAGFAHRKVGELAAIYEMLDTFMHWKLLTRTAKPLMKRSRLSILLLR